MSSSATIWPSRRAAISRSAALAVSTMSPSPRSGCLHMKRRATGPPRAGNHNPAELFGRLALRDDGVGVAPGQLREMVELPFEGADAERRRAELDDQVVQFRLRPDRKSTRLNSSH